ncbi:hypothetical protein L1987_20770 [Smallanthus sonchifolius]|uniref:Uncharacterized protein n=1 Tax=Smallanthus sonchifolius TaxID=185202 RepID=A0ACB9ISZ6_9ASTR|nr:hypothetical protein L1987_20770 [Smallanthus sonchifolius]
MAILVKLLGRRGLWFETIRDCSFFLKGKMIAIVVSVSSVVVLTVSLISVLYARKCRYIQQKRKGYYLRKWTRFLMTIV